MQKVVRSIFSLLLGLLFISSTLNIGVYRMECLISGKVQVEYFNPIDCYDDALHADYPTMHVTCCDHSQFVGQLPAFSLDAQDLDFTATAVPFFQVQLEPVQVAVQSSPFFFYTDSGPPLSASERCNLLQSYLI